MFALAKSETGDGLDACNGCSMLWSKPGNEPESDETEVENLVDEIEDIIFWEDGGSKTDWSLYSFDIYRLFIEWRNAEKEVARIQMLRWQAFLKSKFKSK